MSVYLEMALRLQQDIGNTELHLAKLKAALASLQPLISADIDQAPLLALPSHPRGRASAGGQVIDAAVLVEKVSPAPVAAKRVPRSPKVASEALQASYELPRTGQSFWLALMGKRKHTISSIVDKALAKLQAPEDQRNVLTNRLNAWLYPAVKKGVVLDAGMRGNLKAYAVA